MEFLVNHWLDITTTALGLAYILLEYKASVWMWVVGFVMQCLGIVLYYQKGLYADCGMEFYYLAMTVYGFVNWKFLKGKTATATDSNGDTQVAIRPYSTRGINPTDGNFGCRESALFNIDLHARFVATLWQRTVSLNVLCYNIYDFGNVYSEMCFPEGVRGAGSRGHNMTLTIPRGVVATLKVDL